MIELGKTYRDIASGFTGMATARSEYLNDSPSVRLTACKGATEALVEQWFGEGRLEELAAEKTTGFAL